MAPIHRFSPGMCSMLSGSPSARGSFPRRTGRPAPFLLGSVFKTATSAASDGLKVGSVDMHITGVATRIPRAIGRWYQIVSISPAAFALSPYQTKPRVNVAADFLGVSGILSRMLGSHSSSSLGSRYRGGGIMKGQGLATPQSTFLDRQLRGTLGDGS